MSSASDPRTTLTDMWQTRPTRRQSERKLTGVAGAIARRYDIDPLLVRIGFVVAGIYGVGILVYLAAWVTLPPDPVDPPRGALAGNTARVVAMVLVALIGISSLIDGDLDFLVGLLVIGGLLYLLQTSRGEHGLAMARAEESAGTSGPPPGAASTSPSPTGADSPTGAGSPPAGIASGTPTRRPPGPRRPRSAVTPVTIGLTLLAAGITGAVLLLGGTGLSGPRPLVGVMLAVVGLGLVVGAFVHGGRGLILLALPLLVLGWGVTRAPLQLWQGAGELRVTPTSVDQVASGYDRTFGRVELDLRMLDLDTPAVTPAAPTPTTSPTAPPGSATPPVPTTPQPPGVAAAAPPPEPVRTRVSVQFGEAVVRVPPNADVRVRCHAAVGEVNCLGGPGFRSGDGMERDGPTASAEVDSLGEDGAAGGRPLELDVTVGTGSVEVRRG